MMTQAAHDSGNRKPAGRSRRRLHAVASTTSTRCPTTSAISGAREAIGKLVADAEKLRVHLNIENIFFNGYLMSARRK